VAISNHRLRTLEQGRVSFAYKDYRHPQKRKVMTLDSDEFIRRFLLHALPRGFQRIRYYGFLANCHRAERLQRCRLLLTPPVADLLPRPDRHGDLALASGAPIRRCPQCRIGVLVVMIVLPSHGPVPLRVDTS
jgi:hypothetical protein